MFQKAKNAPVAGLWTAKHVAARVSKAPSITGMNRQYPRDDCESLASGLWAQPFPRCNVSSVINFKLDSDFRDNIYFLIRARTAM